MAAVTVTAGGTAIASIDASPNRPAHVYISHDDAGTLWVDTSASLTSATGVAVAASNAQPFVIHSDTTLYGISTTDIEVRALVL